MLRHSPVFLLVPFPSLDFYQRIKSSKPLHKWAILQHEALISSSTKFTGLEAKAILN